MSDYFCELTYQYSGATLVATCVDCPEVPAVEAVPQQTIIDPRNGWNSGARSSLMRAGDCYVQFSFTTPLAGSICGLAETFASTDPSVVDYGIYGLTDGAYTKFAVIERGEIARAPENIDLSTAVFRIERAGSRIHYYANNVRVHSSDLRSASSLMVVALLYSADDGIV